MSKTSFRTWLSLLPELPTNIRNWEAFLVHAVKMKIYDLWKSAAHKNEKLLLDDARPLEEERHGGDDLGLDPAVVVEETHERAGAVAQVRAALGSWTGANPKRPTRTGRSRSSDGRPRPWPTNWTAPVLQHPAR
jgi:hypothetical protein